MNNKQFVFILVIALSMVFATFFASWVQNQLAENFGSLRFFLSDAGRYVVEVVFLLPLFYVFFTTPKVSKYIKWLGVVMVIRMVVAILSMTVFLSLEDSTFYVILRLFYGLFLDIAILYVVVRIFNTMTYPFVPRASLLLWGILSLSVFAFPSGFELITEQLRYVSFFIAMVILVNVHLREEPIV